MTTPSAEPGGASATSSPPGGQTPSVSPSRSSLPSAALGAVQAALAGEHAAAWAYAVVAARAPRSLTARALSDLGAHRLARDALEDLLVGRGAVPVAAQPGYQVPASSAAALAVGVEERLAAVYLDLVPVAPDTPLLRLAAAGVRDCAVRAARWRGASVAFPGR